MWVFCGIGSVFGAVLPNWRWHKRVVGRVRVAGGAHVWVASGLCYTYWMNGRRVLEVWKSGWEWRWSPCTKERLKSPKRISKIKSSITIDRNESLVAWPPPSSATRAPQPPLSFWCWGAERLRRDQCCFVQMWNARVLVYARVSFVVGGLGVGWVICGWR